METLITFLKQHTAGRQCEDCEKAITFLETIQKSDGAHHQTFVLNITKKTSQPAEIHIGTM